MTRAIVLLSLFPRRLPLTLRAKAICRASNLTRVGLIFRRMYRALSSSSCQYACGLAISFISLPMELIGAQTVRRVASAPEKPADPGLRSTHVVLYVFCYCCTLPHHQLLSEAASLATACLAPDCWPRLCAGLSSKSRCRSLSLGLEAFSGNSAQTHDPA